MGVPDVGGTQGSGGGAFEPSSGDGGVQGPEVIVHGVRPKPPSTLPPDALPKEVVVTARPAAYHIYRIRLISPCRASAVFRYFLQAGHSAPGAPAAQEGTQNLILEGDNPISQYVNSANMTIVNTTLPGHVFYPGSVKIQVNPMSAQTSQVSITGTGDGSDEELNEIVGQGFFGLQALSAQTVCL